MPPKIFLKFELVSYAMKENFSKSHDYIPILSENDIYSPDQFVIFE